MSKKSVFRNRIELRVTDRQRELLERFTDNETTMNDFIRNAIDKALESAFKRPHEKKSR